MDERPKSYCYQRESGGEIQVKHTKKEVEVDGPPRLLAGLSIKLMTGSHT